MNRRIAILLTALIICMFPVAAYAEPTVNGPTGLFVTPIADAAPPNHAWVGLNFIDLDTIVLPDQSTEGGTMWTGLITGGLTDTFEVGLAQELGEGLRCDVSLHYGGGSDFIGRRSIGGNSFEYDNISEVRIGGAEVGLEYRRGRALRLAASYAFNSAVVDEDEARPAIEGNDLSLSPRNRATLRATCGDPGRLAVSAALRHVGSMYADVQNTEKLESYWVFDLRLARRFGGRFEASLSCRDLFDAQYDVPNEAGEDLVSPGRTVSFNLAARW